MKQSKQSKQRARAMSLAPASLAHVAGGGPQPVPWMERIPPVLEPVPEPWRERIPSWLEPQPQPWFGTR